MGSDVGNAGYDRRSFLQATASIATVVGAGSIDRSPADEHVEVVAGHETEDARTTAEEVATSVRCRLSSGAVSLEVPRESVDSLASVPGVRYVERNGPIRAGPGVTTDTPCRRRTGTPTDSDDRVPWGVDRIDADRAWAAGVTGAGVDVAIVDTGIAPNHPDLEGNLGGGVAIVETADGAGQPWADDNGHGTHCAGVAAAPQNGRGVVGVAPDADLHAVKITDRHGDGTYADAAAGIEAVADRGWDVANVSVAGGRSAVVADAVEYARDRGVTIVAAARQNCVDCVGYPAADSGVVAVNATDRDDALTPGAARGSDVEFAAPGTSIYATVPNGYERDSGTSMATPHVSGTVALVLTGAGDAMQPRRRLRSTAEDVGLARVEQGYGLVDAGAAVGVES